MADTQVLRQRLEDQLRSIQEKLKAIEIVEAMSAELGVNGVALHVARPEAMATSAPKTIKATVKMVAEAHPMQEWSASTMTPEVQRHGRPDATRANVTTALRRLGESGELELVSRSKKKGYVYRAKTPRTPVQ